MTDEVTMRLDARQLAEDIDRDATPDFKVTLVQELFRRDPALQAEILENTSEAGGAVLT